MNILEKIYAYGHENVLCTHKSTIELTKKKYLTAKGNCILGINASKSCKDINPTLKKLIMKGEKIKVIIKLGELSDCFYGYGNKKLNLLNEDDIVFRKSSFICDRTILINCNKASNELNPILIEKLKSPNAIITIIFEKYDNDKR